MAVVNLIGSYNYALVVLSVLIAMFASYAALDLAGRVTAAGGWTRAVWLLGGAGAMGTGIWSMHYIGMLAFILPIPVAYHWPTVLLSLFAAILASVVALGVVSRQKLGWFRALAGSVLMGAGIASMHYIGMDAMRLPAICQFNSFLVVLSVMFAVLISLAALWITFHFRDGKTGIGWEKLAGAVVMGAAIPVMHYTGMGAASFTPSGMPADLSHAVSISTLGTAGIAVATFIVLGLALLTSWVDRRFAVHILELQEEKLQQSEAYLSEAQRLSHTGSFGWRPSIGNIIWSEETFRIFQYDRSTKPTVELILQRVHPEDAALVKHTIVRASRDGKDFDFEHRLLMPDGSIKYVHVVAHAERDESGELEFVGAVMDTTESKRAEGALRRSEGYLAEAQKLTHTGSWAWNVRTGALFWSREIFRIYDFEHQETGPTWPQLLERIHPEDRSRIEQSARMEASGKEWLDSANDFRIILPDGTIKHLHSVAHPVRNDSNEVTEVVGTVMDVTEQWKARTELEKAFEEIKQRTEAAHRSERELRDVVNMVPAHVWSTLPEGHVDFVNDRWLQFTGLTWDEAFGWEWEAVIHPDDRTRVASDWHTALKNGRAMESEARVRRADGEYCWWFIRNVPLRDETGKLVRWYGTAIDIEDRKRAEQALRKSEERWRSVFENSAIGVALTDLNGRFLATNHVYQTIVGYTEEELRALYFLDITHEDYRKANRALITELLEGKRRQFQIEKKYLRKDGSSIWVSNNVSLVPGTERVPRFIMALSEDITQRKRAEKALQRSEGYLAEAQKLTHTGSWAVRVPQMETAQREAREGLSVVPRFGWDASYWSTEMYRIFGLDPAPTPPSYMEVVRRLHPEDARYYTPVVEQAIRDRTDFETDHRVLLPNGAAKYIHVVGHPVLNASGDVIELVGTAMDITERKRAEQALRRSEAYLAEAQRLTKTGSWAYNPAAEKVIYWSDEMLRIFGLDPQTSNLPDREEFLRLMHPEDRDRFNEGIEKAFREKADFAQDYRIVLTDGTVKHIHGIGHPVLDETGNIIEYVGTDVDVTERKRAEEKLRRSEADLLEAQRISQTGSWKLDASSGTVTVSPQIFRIFGVKPGEDTSTPEFWFSRNHLEDQQRIQELFERSKIQKTDYDADYRIVLPDGAIKHLHAVGHPVLNESGDLVEFVGTAIDVTEQAQARIELEKAFEEIKRLKDRLHDENLALREQIDQAFMFEEIVGSSPALQTVLSSIVKVAPTDSTVLITGETGTGKELIARAIHKHSQRSGQAFISVNCASIPSSLIASELFGHEKGAFTGAVQRHQGRFELAHSGTIFLDEVGDLPAETQVTLLRVLQERQFERVGGNRILPTDVRVIAATNRDLTAAIAAGTFRADLFYRLNVFPIEVPPLRKRREDIPMLVEYFVKRYAEKAGKQIRKIDRNTLEQCQSYPWPGNIRELQNIVERSVILSSGDTFWIEKAWLANQGATRQELPGPLPDTLQNQEREIIETALAESKGKVAGREGAAARLGIPRSTLDSKIKQLGIKKHRFISE